MDRGENTCSKGKEGKAISWIVEHLIRNKDEIKSKQESDPDLESEDYNNLLILEHKIDTLHDYGILSDIDMLILNSYSDNRAMNELKSIMKDRHAISSSFIQICERIGYFLGGYFTDDGFIENLVESYKLDEEEIEVIKEYISGRFKHKLIRKPTNE